jgi:acyl-coenzyme A thioesterase PaaI-like protein
MQQLAHLLSEAKKGTKELKALNGALKKAIPFNKPHKIKVLSISDNDVKTKIPFKKKNWNHIQGVHACGLATAAEFASGVLILSRVNPAKYRIIMQKMEVEYVYQAKSDIVAAFSMHEEVLEKEIMQPLETQDAVMFEASIVLTDEKDVLVAKAKTTWQIKSWEKVKMQLEK